MKRQRQQNASNPLAPFSQRYCFIVIKMFFFFFKRNVAALKKKENVERDLGGRGREWQWEREEKNTTANGFFFLFVVTRPVGGTGCSRGTRPGNARLASFLRCFCLLALDRFAPGKEETRLGVVGSFFFSLFSSLFSTGRKHTAVPRRKNWDFLWAAARSRRQEGREKPKRVLCGNPSRTTPGNLRSAKKRLIKTPKAAPSGWKEAANERGARGGVPELHPTPGAKTFEAARAKDSRSRETKITPGRERKKNRKIKEENHSSPWKKGNVAWTKVGFNNKKFNNRG